MTIVRWIGSRSFAAALTLGMLALMLGTARYHDALTFSMCVVGGYGIARVCRT